jgi:hypothetical protein
VIGSGGYSSETKLTLIPSVPFRYSFNGVNIDVKSMRLYHPCPVRIDNIQYDAVLSLNDPDDGDRFIMLIPIQASTSFDDGGKADRFFKKLASYIPQVVQQDPEAPAKPVDVPTANDWKLADVIPSTGDANGELVVQSGFFAWRGSLPLDRYKRIDKDESDPRMGSNFVYNHQVYGWEGQTPSPEDLNANANKENGFRKAAGLPPLKSPYPDGGFDGRPQYILIGSPAKVGSYVMSAIHLLPVTPPEHAIHPVPSKGIVYKEYICSASPRKPLITRTPAIPSLHPLPRRS